MMFLSKRRDPNLAWPTYGLYSRFFTFAVGQRRLGGFVLQVGPFTFALH